MKKVCERLKKNLVDMTLPVRSSNEPAMSAKRESFLGKVEAIILAGNADIKHDIQDSGLLDPRIKGKIKLVVDVPYGGAQGFNHAINLTREELGGVKFVKERSCWRITLRGLVETGTSHLGSKTRWLL